MIDPRAEPIGHRSPYRRVDLGKKRRRIITVEELAVGELVDTSLYEFDHYENVWRLKP